MPAPGPGGTWIDDFEGNKLSSKWVEARYSQGGQNDGVWVREVKNSKLYWRNATGGGGGTETGWWGENIQLLLNAPSDIKIEAQVRCKSGGANYDLVGISFNSVGAPAGPAYGMTGFFEGVFKTQGYNIGAVTPWPGFPAMFNTAWASADNLINWRLVRKNGYSFYYVNNTFVGQGVYNSLITSVNIYFRRFTNSGGLVNENWVEYISVTPREVVL
jgi:hypothetical protein